MCCFVGFAAESVSLSATSILDKCTFRMIEMPAIYLKLTGPVKLF